MLRNLECSPKGLGCPWSNQKDTQDPPRGVKASLQRPGQPPSFEGTCCPRPVSWSLPPWKHPDQLKRHLNPLWGGDNTVAFMEQRVQGRGTASPSCGVPALNTAVEDWVLRAPALPMRTGKGLKGRKGAKGHVIWFQNRLTLKTQGSFHSVLEAPSESGNSSRILSTGSVPGGSQHFQASHFMPMVAGGPITNP